MKNMLLLIPLVGLVSLATAQYGPAPPRINIPGAIPLPVENRPAPIPRAQIPERFFATDKDVPSSNAQRFAITSDRPLAPAPAPVPQPKQYRPAPQQVIQRPQAPARQQQQLQSHHYDEDRPHSQQQQQDDERRRKPVAQILRKWRDEHEDGSITWGFESDDGSFKEETIGIDCVTRGSYGYVDPDGEKREFTYETGIRCDPNKRDEEDEEELEEEQQYKNVPAKAKRPQPQQQQQQQQFYRN